MAEADEDLTVAERLGRLLDRGLLPAGGPAEAAERLIERLQRPARVALLGLPGAGKSAILNLLAGTVVVPEVLRLPTIIVQHGEEPRLLCTLADGQVVTVPGNDLEKALVLGPALITLELDLPALSVISLLEVAAGPMEAEQRRASLWAGKRADILIWCSTAYLPKEQLVWEGMPDSYKDNGFLLLTKVDLLGGREAATGMHQRVMQRATGEFLHVLPMSAKEARTAAVEGKPIDRDRFRDSGAAAVISAIKARIQQARQADMDTAELLLAQHVEKFEAPPRPKHELRAVEAVPPVQPDDEALAAEAAALQRIATAAGSQAPAPETSPLVLARADTPGTIAGIAKIDPFPEPEGTEEEVDEPRVKAEQSDDALVQRLRAILGTTPSLTPSADAGRASDLDLASPTEGEEAESEAADPKYGQIEDQVQTEETIIAPVDLPEGADSSPRFAARLKEISTGPDDASTGLVPLRATWRSRNDMINAMPIVPKPEPNRNPTPRQLPAGAGSARLVGRASRQAEPADEISSLAEAPETGLSDPTAPLSDADLGSDVAGQAVKPVEGRSAATERLALTKAMNVAVESPAALMPDRGDPSDRLRRPVDPVAVTKVKRTDPSLPSPQDIVSPPLDVSRYRVDQPQTSHRHERPRIAPRVTPGARSPIPSGTSLLPTEKLLLEQGVSIIVARSAELYDQIDPEEKPPVDHILEHVAQSVDQVLAVLAQGASPQIRRISTSFGEVQDLVMLMQLEKGRVPADDALTLLLQLRREMETLSTI